MNKYFEKISETHNYFHYNSQDAFFYPAQFLKHSITKCFKYGVFMLGISHRTHNVCDHASFAYCSAI